MTTSHQDSPVPSSCSPDPVASSLPDPTLFDVIPSLHTLLTRLIPTPSGLAAPKDAASTTAPPPTAATAPTPQTQPTATTTTTTTTTTGPQPATADPTAPGTDALEIHQLAAATSALKVRVQRGRAAVRALPDVARSVEEQEEEIAALEGRVDELVGILEGLRRKAALVAGEGDEGETRAAGERGMEGVVRSVERR